MAFIHIHIHTYTIIEEELIYYNSYFINNYKTNLKILSFKLSHNP